MISTSRSSNWPCILSLLYHRDVFKIYAECKNSEQIVIAQKQYLQDAEEERATSRAENINCSVSDSASSAYDSEPESVRATDRFGNTIEVPSLIEQSQILELSGNLASLET